MAFSEAEFANKRHTTRREIFMKRTDKLIPWGKLEKELRKHYLRGEIVLHRIPCQLCCECTPESNESVDVNAL